MSLNGSQIFDAGVWAHDAGVPRDKCPHAKGSPARRAWLKGWTDGWRSDGCATTHLPIPKGGQ